MRKSEKSSNFAAENETGEYIPVAVCGEPDVHRDAPVRLILKWFYRPQAYSEHFHELFPAQRAVGVIYLMQEFEIPYLLHIGEPHITIDMLIQRLGTNSKYIAEVIHRSGYQSFYDMICQHRVRHAIRLIHEHPEERLGDISDRCGFSSPSSMNKAFKAQGKEPPSTYKG